MMRIGFIEKEDLVYQEILDEISEDLRRKEVIPFLGAGISFNPPSLLPGGKELQQPLFEILLKVSELPILQRELKRKGIKPFSYKVIYEARLEQLLDVLQKTHGEAMLSYLNVLISNVWNKNHGAISSLAVNGYLQCCITLNFDLLIEEAIHNQGKESQTVNPLINRRFPLTGDFCIEIIKPHGSFVPYDIHSNPFELISATLSEVGHIPNKHNIKAIRKLFSEFPILLIAGYSNNDWDIFPILVSESKLLKKILWIEYLDIKRHKLQNKQTKILQKRVNLWLNSFQGDSILLYGKCETFFLDILQKLNLKLPKIEINNREAIKPDVSFLSIKYEPDDLPSIRTLVSFSMLQPTGDSKLFLIRWLMKHEIIKSEYSLQNILENQIGHEFHTLGKMRKAIHYTKRVLTYRLRTNNIPPKEITDIYIWLGYEYLCLAKRPLVPFIHWLFLIPYYKFKANYYFEKGLDLIQEEDERRYFEGMVEYYKIDLIHSWGNLIMFLLGRSFIDFQKKFFTYVYNRYNTIAENYDVLEDRYHWLRKLEAFLFSGGKVHDYIAIEKKIDEIEYNYTVLQNFVQMGNTFAYRALLKYFQYEEDEQLRKIDAIKLLKKAANVWKESGEKMASAQRRLIVFRRYFGDINLFFGTLYFFMLRDIFNDKWELVTDDENEE